MENPTRIDDLGAKPTIFGNIYLGNIFDGWSTIPPLNMTPPQEV